MLVLALATGCGSSSTAPPGTTGNPALNAIDPAHLRDVVARAATQLRVPGAMVLVRTPQGDVTAPFGTTELGKDTPPDGGTHFRIASNTKTMTAALIVLLAQDGKLDLVDPVARYLPQIPGGAHITIANLLTMRSGIYGYTSDPELAQILDSDPAKVWAPQDGLDIALRHPPLFAPDTQYDYSNSNFAALGLIAEQVGGRPLREQFQDRLFTPLGLGATLLPAADDIALPQPFSHGYMYGGTRYALADDPYPADLAEAARNGTLEPIDYTHQNPSYATAAGGAISTANDLADWMRALVTGKAFNAEFHQQWLASLQPEDPQTPDGQQYGFGISYQRFGPHAAMYYHGGEMPGFNSFMGYDPENAVTLVIWTNLTLSPDGRTTAQALLPTMLEQIYAGLSLPSG